MQMKETHQILLEVFHPIFPGHQKTLVGLSVTRHDYVCDYFKTQANWQI